MSRNLKVRFILSEIGYDRDLIVGYFIYFYDLILRITYDYIGANQGTTICIQRDKLWSEINHSFNNYIRKN